MADSFVRDRPGSMAQEATPVRSLIKVPDENDVILEKLEQQLDAVPFQQKFFEGEELTDAESHKRYHELKQLAGAVNVRLADMGVKVIGAHPELNGRGARLVARDLQGRSYDIDLHVDDEQRMTGASFDAMLDGLDTVNLIERSVRARFAAYLEEERMSKLGVVRGKKAV